MKKCKIKGCDEPQKTYEVSYYNELLKRNTTLTRYLGKCSTHYGEAVKNGMKKARGGTTLKREKRYVDDNGYVQIYVEGRGRIAEHKLVMETLLGRNLQPGENVHHINGIRHDNRPENLELWIRVQPVGIKARTVTCPGCGLPYQ